MSSKNKRLCLNLGCGNDIRVGWENFDKYPVNSDVKHLDISSLPLPFSDGYADEILISHLFEHLSCNKYSLMKEISRILKPDGKVVIRVPVNHQCCEHESNFFTPDYFNGITTSLYGSLFRKVDVISRKNKIRDIIWMVKQFVFWVIYKEITYELKK